MRGTDKSLISQCPGRPGLLTRVGGMPRKRYTARPRSGRVTSQHTHTHQLSQRVKCGCASSSLLIRLGSALCLLFLGFLVVVVSRCALLLYACYFTHVSKGCNLDVLPHEVSFYIGFPSHRILYMLQTNSILGRFSKKCNFYMLVVSAVMCVVTFLSVMLCCIVLYCVVPCSIL